MYAGVHAIERADQPCIVMATSGEVVTYAEYDARTNRLAHLLRSHGLHDQFEDLDTGANNLLDDADPEQ